MNSKEILLKHLNLPSNDEIDEMVTFENFPETELEIGHTLKWVRIGMLFMRDLVKKRINESKPLDKEELREKFFKECTETEENPEGWGLYINQFRPKINIAPNDLFEWFWKEIKG